MSHKNKIYIYLISINIIFIERAKKFIENLNVLQKEKYEIVISGKIDEGLIETISIWDIIIVDENVIENFEKVKLLYAITQNIVLFSTNIDLNKYIFENELNILILPHSKTYEDIELYEEYLYTLTTNSYLSLNRDLRSDDIIEFNFDAGKIELIAKDLSIKESIQRLKNISKRTNDIEILITGNTGTGKNYLAKYFYYLRKIERNQTNKDKNYNYCSIDVGNLSPELALSELFGHLKGSFTGADRDKDGIIEKSQGGFLHIDELGNNKKIQEQLLTLIQERKYKKVGSNEYKNFKGDIIITTNVDFRDEEKFRQDLRYRIAYKIILPDLKDRKKELQYLIDFYEEKKLKGKGIQLDSGAKLFLLKQEWPGNVRQLESFFINCSITDNSKIDKEIAEKIYVEL